MSNEQCWLCSFWKDDKCTNTFRLVIHIEPRPGLGGQVDFSTTPGMIPEELIPRVATYMQKFLEKALPAISLLPVWDEVAQYQLSHPECMACPGKQERKDIKPYLHIVRTQI